MKFFFKKASNGKLIKCIYLFPSKLTEMHIAIKKNEKKKKKKKKKNIYCFKKAICCCNGKLILLCLLIFKSFIFCFIDIV